MKLNTLNRYLALPLAMTAISLGTAQALEVKASNSVLQGGSNSSVTWPAPATQPYRVYVRVPADSTATNALYRVYPNGLPATAGACSSTDATTPCFEIPLDTTQSPGEWVQLTLANDPATQWDFTQNPYVNGNVTVNASNLNSSEVLSTGSVLFDAPSIGQAYQGGILISLSKDGKHGLIAANQDLPGTYNFQAAKQAVKDSANYDAEGQKYSDWRLPNVAELNIVYQHQDLVKATASFYWTGVSSSKTLAWIQIFRYSSYPAYSGFQANDGYKTGTLSVRPVRSF
jgi:hypothetical protein